MTKEAQRIAIAEACGRDGWWCPQCKKLVSEYSLGYQNRHANCSESAQQPPNYLEDLNAIHEAEKVLTNPQYQKYRDWFLEKVVQRDWHAQMPKFPESRPANLMKESSQSATASQRAEAFLRTIGKWVD